MCFNKDRQTDDDNGKQHRNWIEGAKMIKRRQWAVGPNETEEKGKSKNEEKLRFKKHVTPHDQPNSIIQEEHVAR